MKRSTLIGGLAIGFALAMTVSAPASASPVQIIPWEESFTEVLEVGEEDWCPPDIVDFDVTYSLDGGGIDRITTQHDGILRFAGTFKAVETYSANGKTFMIESQGNRRDHRIVDNGDDTLTIQFKNSVKSTVSIDGEFLFHDSGLDEGAFLVDHNGTPAFPDDDIFLGVIGEPQFHGRSDTVGRDFCEDIAFYLAP
jgi:hypothetical protein